MKLSILKFGCPVKTWRNLQYALLSVMSSLVRVAYLTVVTHWETHQLLLALELLAALLPDLVASKSLGG